MPKTLYDKIWNDHLVHQQDDGTALLFVDRHLVLQTIMFQLLIDQKVSQIMSLKYKLKL